MHAKASGCGDFPRGTNPASSKGDDIPSHGAEAAETLGRGNWTTAGSRKGDETRVRRLYLYFDMHDIHWPRENRYGRTQIHCYPNFADLRYELLR